MRTDLQHPSCDDLPHKRLYINLNILEVVSVKSMGPFQGEEIQQQTRVSVECTVRTSDTHVYRSPTATARVLHVLSTG